MALRYYRGIEFIKDYLVRYLTAIYMAEEKGEIDFYDGTKQVKFSSRPLVKKKSLWDARTLPCVLIGGASGKLTILDVTKDYIHSQQSVGAANQYKDHGGDIELTVEFEAWATTMEERDKLMDITAIYLAHPAAKDYLNQHYITVRDAPSVREGGPIAQPGIDYPVYNSFLSMPVLGTWRDTTELPDRLIDIVAYLTLEESIEI